MFWDIQLITAKEEVTYGTDPVPTGAANSVLAQNVKLTPMAATEVKRQHARPYQGARPSLLVGQHMKISFEVEAKASGTAGTAPGYAVFLRSCKMAEVIVASTSVTYNPVSTAHKSCTIYFYIDGILFKIVGARGDWNYKLNADGIVVIEFMFTGLFTLATDTAIATPTYGTQLTQIPQVATTETVPTFSIGAFVTPALRSFSFNAGNAVVFRNIIRRRQVIITGSDETMEFQIEAEALATFNPYSLASAMTPQAVSLVHGVGVGKIVTLSAPRLQILNPGDLSQQDGVVENTLRGICQPSDTGNDQFTLAFT
jgi:hypothetical protein